MTCYEMKNILKNNFILFFVHFFLMNIFFLRFLLTKCFLPITCFICFHYIVLFVTYKSLFIIYKIKVCLYLAGNFLLRII